MRRTLRLLCPLIMVAGAMPSHAADLTLRRVMLSTAGVGYVEYAAPADGPVTFQLPVPLEQVDDVLKSIVVFDSAGGVGGVELPPRDRLASAFGDVPFGPDALANPAAYLAALRGVVLEVIGPRPMTGRLMGAESERAGEGERTRTRVSLLTAEGLRQFVLEEADSVRVADPALREGIERAMDATRRDAARDMRVLTLRGSGTGQREVRVGYVAGASLWKTTYRLVLPAPDATPAKARLQGWAVLENTTGRDWNGVELTLQYGNPVSFRQALYRTYFVRRPEVPVQVLGQVLPDVDIRATGGVSARAELAPAPPPAAMLAPPMPAPVAAAPRMAPMAPPAERTQSSEGAEETVFTLATPVVLPAGHTASVPILDRVVAAARIGLVPFNRTHPLAAIRVTNDTTTSLPAGVLTVYDPSGAVAFSGDARLGGLPVGETRLLSFAEDMRTTAIWSTDEQSGIASMTAAQGMVRYEDRLRRTIRVDLAAPAGERRDLLVEVTKQPGFDLVTEGGPTVAEETALAWRFAVALAPAERKTLTVRLDRMVREQVSLTGNDQVFVRLLNLRGLDDKARAGLQRLVDLNAAVTARRTERERLEAQRNEADQAQDRIRKNLAAVPTADALHGRLVRQLEAEDKRIGDLRGQIEKADAELARAREALATGINTLRF